MKSANANPVLRHNLKQSLELAVPSKTFLLGEYVALKGGPILVLTTEPKFKLKATFVPDHAGEVIGIHPESPAGLLFAKDKQFYRNYKLEFIDPYRGLGGFGASSAQFILLAALKHTIDGKEMDDYELLDSYIKLAWSGEGMPPSGVDIIAQLHGEICYFWKVQRSLTTYAWPFNQISFAVIHTGNKVSTHIHLKELKSVDTSKLESIVLAGKESLKIGDSTHFIEAIECYSQVLAERGLVLKQTQVMLEKLKSHPGILAAKGCGALGADVILVILDTQKQDEVISWIKENNFNLITYGHRAAKGLDQVYLK